MRLLFAAALLASTLPALAQSRPPPATGLEPHEDTSAAMEDSMQPHETKTGTLTGTLTGVTDSSLSIRDAHGRTVQLTRDSSTHAMERGREVSLPALKEGTEVRASYLVDGHQRIARDVQVLSKR